MVPRRKRRELLHSQLKVFNMNIKILLIITLIFLNSAAISLAQTATPKPTVSETVNEKLNTQINQLKDKIASRVTELNLVEKRGFYGEVAESSTNKVTLKGVDGSLKIVDIDEITKFSSGNSKTFGLSDLTNGTKITVLGLYNKQTKRMLARFISTTVNPVFLTGSISTIDIRNTTIEVLSPDQKTTRIDVGTATKITYYDADGTPTRGTLSRLTVGARVTVIGYPDKSNASVIIADRISVLADAPKDPKANIEEPTPTSAPTVRPTTPSVRRVSPTINR
jgi:hypothetical protein